MPAWIWLITVMHVHAGHTLEVYADEGGIPTAFLYLTDPADTCFNKKDTYPSEAAEQFIGFSPDGHLKHAIPVKKECHPEAPEGSTGSPLFKRPTYLQKRICHPEAPEGSTGSSLFKCPTHLQKRTCHPEALEGSNGSPLFKRQPNLQKRTCHPEAPEGSTGSPLFKQSFNTRKSPRKDSHKQAGTDSINYRKRQNLCYTVGLGGTIITHIGLYQLWYKDYPSSKFHFFNDNREWLQMDKFGHAFSSYYLGVAAIEAAKWAGVPENKQWKWALFGSIFQDPIEIWDGFSAGWGASTGDLLANTFGTVLSAGQHALWKEQKFTLKLSYTPSEYARIRPNVLGSNPQERLLKDYNAQTYWLTYSPIKHQKWAWLGLALGYGAEGMVGGEDNIWTDKYNVIQDRSDIRRYRQYYLGLDYNLTRINTRRKGLKTLFFILNCIKLPSPALEFSNNRLKGHWLKF